ncbi:MAG: response regulator [Actinomycetota bacterium]|nr:response regulator [Actinomycetota bacterium]
MVSEEAFERASILVVDDQEANVLLMERILKKAGYVNVSSTTDPREVLSLYDSFDPDLIILDLLMPYVDGFQVMEQLSKVLPDGTYLPILVLTADLTTGAMHRALSMGAKDFLHKPFDSVEVLLRIRNLLETRFMHVRLRDHTEELERKVLERTEALSKSLERMTEMAEHRRSLLGRLSGVNPPAPVSGTAEVD